LDIPFIIVSGYIDEETAVNSLKSGASDFILKSNLSRLAPAIERELRNKQIRRELNQTSDVLNASFVQLRDKVARLELITSFHENLHGIVDLKKLFEKIYEIVPKYFGINRVSLLLYDEKQNTLISDQLIGVERFSKISSSAPQPIGHSISGVCFQERRPIILNDCSQTDLIPKKYVDILNLKSCVAIPIIRRDKVLGVLRIDDTERINRFSNSDVQLYTMICEQLGMVMENAFLFTQLKQTEKIQKILATLGQQLSEVTTPKEVATTILKIADEFIGWDACSLEVYREKGTRGESIITIDTVDGQKKEFPPIFMGEEVSPMFKRVVKEGSLLILRKDSELKRAVNSVAFGDKAKSSASLMFVPIQKQKENIGFLTIQSYTLNAYDQQDLELLQILTDHCGGALARTFAEQDKQIQLERINDLWNLSILDPLTGLFNRRYLEETLEREMKRAIRYQRPVSILMMDIDYFKRINDLFGHVAGDALLKRLGSFMLAFFRREDIVCRYGGEEFIVILPEDSLENAQKRAEEFRKGFNHLNVIHQEKTLGPLSISIGISAYPNHGAEAKTLLQIADRALYSAKSNGRDRVVIGDAV
jgi:diguanylate cyclase (GGDEF)-like protein